MADFSISKLSSRRVELLDGGDDNEHGSTGSLNLYECYTNTATDAVVWDAGIVLAKYLAFASQSPRARFSLEGKAVLDVGSGTGVAGLTAALLGASALLCDTEPVLPLLKHNCFVNRAAVAGNSSRRGGAVAVMELEWKAFASARAAVSDSTAGAFPEVAESPQEEGAVATGLQGSLSHEGKNRVEGDVGNVYVNLPADKGGGGGGSAFPSHCDGDFGSGLIPHLEAEVVIGAASCWASFGGAQAEGPHGKVVVDRRPYHPDRGESALPPTQTEAVQRVPHARSRSEASPSSPPSAATAAATPAGHTAAGGAKNVAACGANKNDDDSADSSGVPSTLLKVPPHSLDLVLIADCVFYPEGVAPLVAALGRLASDYLKKPKQNMHQKSTRLSKDHEGFSQTDEVGDEDGGGFILMSNEHREPALNKAAEALFFAKITRFFRVAAVPACELDPEWQSADIGVWRLLPI